jgi:hypothetical protein
MEKFRVSGSRSASGPTPEKAKVYQSEASPVIRPERLKIGRFHLFAYNLLSMGRQTRFHMLSEDCRRFVQFLQERDPVIVTEVHSSESAEVQAVSRPWENRGFYCLWNQAIIPTLSRRATGKYFNIDF